MIMKKDAIIDWSEDYEKLVLKIRGLNPSPGAVTMAEGKRIKIYSAASGEPTDDKDYGKIWGYFEDKGLGIVAGGGIIYITEIQPENSRRMPVSEYIKGHKIEPGEIWG